MYLSIDPFLVVEKFPRKPDPKPPVTLSCPGRKLEPTCTVDIDAIEFVCGHKQSQALPNFSAITRNQPTNLRHHCSPVKDVHLHLPRDIIRTMVVIIYGDVPVCMKE